MYLKRILPMLFLFSTVGAFKINTRVNPVATLLRMKKTLSHNYDHDQPTSNRKLKIKNMAPNYSPRSENQKQYVTHLNDEKIPIVLGIGPAGCGKTLFACLSAIKQLRAGDIQKIVLTRPIVPVEEEELGFLPGTLVKKMDPWTRPLMDIFLEYYPQHELDFMLNSGVIEISPLAYMRGRTFKRCFIIADEMQNSTPNQMLMLTTRIGEHSKMVITGDLKQTDRCENNGLLDIMIKIKDYTRRGNNDIGIEMVEMKYSDIERSPIVSKILEIYKKPVDDVDMAVSRKADTVSNNSTAVTDTAEVKKNNDAALIPITHMLGNKFLL
jgi:phosphate starvation-inducible PhoH-like protein